MIKLTFTKRAEKAPLWAVLQRQLFRTLDQCREELLERYVLPNGYLKWPARPDYTSVDGLDDMYESFHNWPLYYLAGGDAAYLQAAQREFEAITEQGTHYDCGHGHPMVVKEYEQGYDWMHQGEGYALFYFLNLADPQNPVNRNRSQRYAGFYLGEDPEAVNYDPERRMMLCPHVGSKGAAHRNFDGAPWTMADWKQWYGLPFHDLEGIATLEDIEADPEKAARMGQAIRERFAYSDSVVNLLCTSLIMNAYLHTGEEKYREWILEYSGAWRQRTEENGGLVPDNVGPGGVIGGTMPEGKWYGGNYGWTWPHGFYFVADSLTVATENELLLTGEWERAEWVRSHYRALRERAIPRDGTLYLPMKKGDPGAVQEYRPDAPDRVLLEDDAGKVSQNPLYRRYVEVDGWYEFMPLPLEQPAHLWFLSRERADYDFIWSLQDFRQTDWAGFVPSYSMKKCAGGHDLAWMNYLNGRFHEYPEKILELNLNHAYKRIRMIQDDTQDPMTYNDSYLQYRNPVTVEGLVQLTMGGPLPIYNGGLLLVSLRYFDADRRRPGLPEDVAALVSALDGDGVTVILCNLSPAHSRRMLLLGGAYGEHRIVSAAAEGRETAVNGAMLEVELGPAAAVELRLTMKRYANKPAYIDPFH